MTLVISDSKSQTKKEVYPVGWYVLSVSSQIKSRPVGIRRLGIDLVLWRDGDGKILCQSRHCPHRGVDLALGKIAQQNGKSCLECPYHGFRFAGNGSCVLIPCNGEDSRISPKMRVESYRVEESHGFIWLWWGDEGLEIPKIDWFEELGNFPRRFCNGEMVWDVNFTRVVESALIDVHHFVFAHHKIAKWSGIGDAKRLDNFEAEVVGNQIKTKGVLKSEGNNRSLIRFKNKIIFPNLSVFDFGLGGIKLFATFTPIDENKTWVGFRYYIPFGLPWISRWIAKIAVWFELNFVQPDDYRLIKSSIPRQGSLKGNGFVRADETIVRWHQLNKHHQQK